MKCLFYLLLLAFLNKNIYINTINSFSKGYKNPYFIFEFLLFLFYLIQIKVHFDKLLYSPTNFPKRVKINFFIRYGSL